MGKINSIKPLDILIFLFLQNQLLNNRSMNRSDILAEVITIGDEILFGQILDTNTQWMSQLLDSKGIKVIRRTAIGDDETEILKILAEAEKRADIILITGGLGPTSDDLTKPVMAKYFDSPISINEVALQELTVMFESRGYELTETNKKQAELPEKCQMISNKLGTAPGMWFEKGKKIFVSMPGVPFEMKAMMDETVLPRLLEYYKPPVIVHKLIKTTGIGESWLSDKIKDWEKELPAHIKLAYLPSLSMVRLRLTATGIDEVELRAAIDNEVTKVLPLISDYVYGFDDDTLESTIGKLLVAQQKTIAIAESCTGGYISHMITKTPGSSAYFQGAVVPYHNSFKVDLLEVSQQTIAETGAVSEATVKEMAGSVREKFSSSIGIAVSGIAGPGGGTPEKPVGTVWIAIADEHKTITKKLNLGRTRILNIQSTAMAVLNLLWQSLIQKR